MVKKIVIATAFASVAVLAGCGSTSSSSTPASHPSSPKAATSSPSSASTTMEPTTKPMTPSESASKMALADCHPYTTKGTCYTVGEQCPKADYGDGGATAAGIVITCESVKGVWRWETAPSGK